MITMMLLTALALITLIITVGCLRMVKQNRLQSEKIAALQNQLAALCAGAVGTDERILRFEKTLSKIKEHQNTLDLSVGNAHSYDHAIRLARKGVSMEQLIDNCNLSDEEAHLISRLHGSEQAPNTQNELH